MRQYCDQFFIYSFSEHSRQHVIRATGSDVREREDNLVDQCVRKARKYMSDGIQKEMMLLEREAGCICILLSLWMEEEVLH